MPIETLDDIVEQLADQVGIYGAHPESNTDYGPCECRCCWTMDLKERLLKASEIQRLLSGRVVTDA